MRPTRVILEEHLKAAIASIEVAKLQNSDQIINDRLDVAIDEVRTALKVLKETN